MSAPPTWEQFDALYARIDRAEAALAVARKREQRAVEALREIADRHPDAKTGAHPAVDIARTTLATLVEPDGATESQQATSLGGLGAADTRGAKPSGSASAAADEGQANAKERQTLGAASAAADEPGETP